ncbi:hypothetical protein [Levilactobacillus acidifarinae]|uniref:Extracellular protein n=1 Tax=Levilactobacillus acidifarinae DSM 19394 = JCM 15949 TaxID=1423715 RepID=A0A0R1LNJ2_9LACO|nr:hypothetical protein [Levilactobacillus acidifarinae]KRK93722.1 hypothetical protein FD25_GL001048 [Levilactobacillus acidifarinae DSM 19394]GEO70789.1 hypothetical protein LAC03_26990 [Levilactobacillus acidifarinae]
MAKHKLLAGLVLGGAAYAAYHALDLEKREALKDMAREQCDALKDRAIDYAFYAADALDDFKENLNEHMGEKAPDDGVEDWRTATDETADATDDDIVLSSDDVSAMTDDAPSEPATSETAEPTAETSTDAETSEK